MIGHSSWVIALAQLHNHWLVSSSRDSSIRLWDLNEKRHVRTLNGHTNAVFSILVLNDGQLASASYDDTIKIWDPYLPDKACIMTMSGHGIINFPVDLNILPNGDLVTCSNEIDADNKIKIWRIQTGQVVKEITTNSKGARSLLALPDGRLAVGFQHGDIRLIEIEDDIEPKRIVIKNEGDTWGLKLLPCGYLLSTGLYRDRTMRIWNLANGKLVQSINLGHNDGVMTVAIKSDGKTMVTGSQDKTVKLWSLSFY